MLAEVLCHVGPHLLDFLHPEETWQLRATNAVLRGTCHELERHMDRSFRHGHQWASLVKQHTQLHDVKLYPNTLPYLHSALATHHLVTLDLSACGISSLNLKNTGLVPTLCQASNLQHFTVSHNPNLKTSGMSCLLKALGEAGAFLKSLYATNTGIRHFPTTNTPLLSHLAILNLARNPIGKRTAMGIVDALPRLQKVFMDLDVEDATDISIRKCVDTVSWCRCRPQVAQTLLGSPGMTHLSIACRSPLLLSHRHIGAALVHLSLTDVDMPDTQWASFLRDLASHTSLRELALCKPRRLSVHSLVTFVTHLREPLVFTALGLLHLAFFTYHDLGLLCTKMSLQSLKMRKWTLSNCRSLKFQACAQDFIRTLHPHDKIYLDLDTCPALSLSRRHEAAWIGSVLTCGVHFRYLALGGRSVIMDAPATLFPHVEHMALDSTEINWGFHPIMTQLKTVSLYNVESRYLSNEQLVEQVLRLPHIAQLRLDYCRLVDPIEFPVAKYLRTLDLNWCAVESDFWNPLYHALVMGKFPALVHVGLKSSSSNPAHCSVVCLIVLAMKGGHRQCEMDARGHAWTADQLQFLSTSLSQLHPGDMTRLQLTIHPDAQDFMDSIRLAFPTLVLR